MMIIINSPILSDQILFALYHWMWHSLSSILNDAYTSEQMLIMLQSLGLYF